MNQQTLNKVTEAVAEVRELSWHGKAYTKTILESIQEVYHNKLVKDFDIDDIVRVNTILGSYHNEAFAYVNKVISGRI